MRNKESRSAGLKDHLKESKAKTDSWPSWKRDSIQGTSADPTRHSQPFSNSGGEKKNC
jgi:hypothetical protein